jgi:hypothetical protein
MIVLIVLRLGATLQRLVSGDYPRTVERSKAEDIIAIFVNIGWCVWIAILLRNLFS